jgi:sortase A
VREIGGRRRLRRLAAFLLAAGVATLAWLVLVIAWQDPFTALYAARQQDRLETEYEAAAPRSRPDPAPVQVKERSDVERLLRRAARSYRVSLPPGRPMGRLTVPRLGLELIVLNGASGADLRRGPGRDLRTFMPGEGKLVYVAGHRTTYGAPFRHIDDLRRRDFIFLEVPYGRFRYAVTGSVVVTPDDTGRLRPRGREELALQASHPPYSARQRYIVYAKLVGFAGFTGASRGHPPTRL